MGKTGRNITPPDMKNIELRKNLLKHCDNALKLPESKLNRILFV